MKRKDIKELLEFAIYKLSSYLEIWKSEKDYPNRSRKDGFSKEYLAYSIVDLTGLIKKILNKVKLPKELALRAEKNIKEVYQLLEEDNSLSTMALNGVNLDSFVQDFINYVQRYEQGRGDQNDMAETSKDFLIGRDTLERFLYVLEEANLSSEIKGEVNALRHNLSDIDNTIKDKLFCLYPAAPFAQEYIQRYGFTREDLEKYWWWKEVAELQDSEGLEFLAKIAFKLATKEKLQPGSECLDENLMAATLDKKLDLEELKKVEAHLRECDYCLISLKELQREILLLEKTYLPPVPQHILEGIKVLKDLSKPPLISFSKLIWNTVVRIRRMVRLGMEKSTLEAFSRRFLDKSRTIFPHEMEILELKASGLNEIEAEADGEKIKLKVIVQPEIEDGNFLLGLTFSENPEKYEGWSVEIWGVLDGEEEKMFDGVVEKEGIVFTEKIEGLEKIFEDLGKKVFLPPEALKIRLIKRG